jgi:hypothetical protein
MTYSHIGGGTRESFKDLEDDSLVPPPMCE